jgi:uncharacterized protein
MSELLSQWKGLKTPVIGMLHLLPLPGSPLFGGDLKHLHLAVMRDAEFLVEGGVDGLMIENFGDVPFYPGRVPAHVVAHVMSLAIAVRGMIGKCPLGINILRNDGQSALAVAHAVGASFIRVNVLCGARVTDQGIIQGIAHELLRDRAMLDPKGSIKILADVDVKHSAPLARREIADEIDDTLARGLADALIISGAGTGKQVDPARVAEFKKHAKRAPVFIGSGVSAETIQSYIPHCDGFIIGTSIKKDGEATNKVDVVRVRELMKRVKA